MEKRALLVQPGKASRISEHHSAPRFLVAEIQRILEQPKQVIQCLLHLEVHYYSVTGLVVVSKLLSSYFMHMIIFAVLIDFHIPPSIPCPDFGVYQRCFLDQMMRLLRSRNEIDISIKWDCRSVRFILLCVSLLLFTYSTLSFWFFCL